MTAGDQQNQVIDHFPISRAGRWQSNQNKINEDQNDRQAPSHQPYQNIQNDQKNQTKHKRSGTASYSTTNSIKITVSRDKKPLIGNLKTEKEANMNLMFYDFNNLGVVSEESTRNMLKSQTTDRGPSRNQRNKSRQFISSQQKPRSPHYVALESSGEFDAIPEEDVDNNQDHTTRRNMGSF